MAFLKDGPRELFGLCLQGQLPVPIPEEAEPGTACETEPAPPEAAREGRERLPATTSWMACAPLSLGKGLIVLFINCSFSLCLERGGFLCFLFLLPHLPKLPG